MCGHAKPAERQILIVDQLVYVIAKQIRYVFGVFAERGDAVSLSYSPRQRKRAGDEYTQKHLDQGGGMDPS